MKNNHRYTTFYIVRHGETEANVQKIIQGQKDYPLNKNGEQQAIDRARSLRQVKFDAVFSSDLMRASRTAEIIALEKRLTVTTTKALRERCFGKYEGTSRYEENVQKIFDLWYALADKEWMKHKIDERFETGEEMVVRLICFLREIAVGFPGKTILAVCHEDLMRNALIHFGFGTRDQLRGPTISNTSYFILETDGIDFFVKKTEGIKKQTLSA